MSPQFEIASDHPAVADHFPGHPVVPAAIILREVCAAVQSPAHTVVEVQSAKFLAPLYPGEPCEIEFDASDSTVVNFRCRSRQRLIAAGRLTLAEQT